MLKLSEFLSHTIIENSQFPKNFEFNCTNQESKFKQPGIFFLFFRGELIYIGYTNNNQHVIGERIVRQIATITLRDHRVKFTEAALKKLNKIQTFKSYFTMPTPLVDTNDFVTSVNRVAFAAYHWDEFKNFNSDTLNRFEFEWYPNPKLGIHQDIVALCNELKNKYKPRCNQEYSRPKLK
jgi:hypothetical protein